MVESLNNGLLTEKKSFGGKIKYLFREYGYLFISFIVPLTVMYIIYLAMEIHPFGNGSVLVLDLNGQYVDFYEALRHFIYGDASVLYSFSRALGGEFMGMYAYYLASPFSYIVALFPQSDILNALLTIFLIKTGMCGFTFGFYLHKTSSFKKSFSRVNVITFSILYALTAYCVVQQHNSMWIDAVMWLPIITYGIEELIKKGHYKLYTISLAVSLMSNFYIGFMTCIYTAIYFFVYYFMHNENRRNNPYGEKAHFAKSFLRILFFSVLALAISALVLLTAYYSLTFGKTTFSSASWDFQMRFELLDMFVKFLPCSYDTVRPEGLPFVYCGVLTLLLLPVYFCSTRISTREKVLAGVLVAIFLLSFAISPVDLIWHGFQKPNWLNYRYSFMLCFILLTLGYQGLSEIKRANIKTLVFSASVLGVLIMIAQKFEFASFVLGDGSNDRNHEVGKLLTVECIWLSIALVGVYLLILSLMRRVKKPQNIAIVLAIIVSVEVFCNGLSNCLDLGSDVVYTSYSTYTNYIQNLRAITTKVQDFDKSFYRMDELTHRKVNDNMAVNAHGLTNSTSTLNATTIQFLQNMGYFAKSHEAQYHGGNIVSDSLLGIKYVLDKSSDSKVEIETIRELLKDENFYTEFTTEGKYTAYRNDYALSLAYAVDSSIYDIDMGEYRNPFDRLNALITAMLGEDELITVFKEMPIIEKETINCTEGPVKNPHGTNYDYPYVQYSSSSEDDHGVLRLVTQIPYTDGSDSDPAKHYVYFYLPSEFQRAFTLRTPNGVYGSMFGNNTMRAVPIGEYEEGRYLGISLTLDSDVLYLTQGIGIFYYLDEALFDEVINKLAQTQLIIDEDYSDDHITGTITTTAEAQTVFTSIPFDSGWQIYVDGKKVETRGILGDSTNEYETDGATIAFDIEGSGKHTVELKYRPRAFTLGLTLTVAGSVILLLIIIFEKKINKVADKILCPIVIPLDGIEDDGEFVEHGESTADQEQNNGQDKQEELEQSTFYDHLAGITDAEPIYNEDFDSTEPAEPLGEDSDADGGNTN